MMTIRGKATIGPGGSLTMQVPPDLPPGEHDVALTVLQGGTTGPAWPFDLPLVEVDEWPADLSLRREDLYGDWGR